MKISKDFKDNLTHILIESIGNTNTMLSREDLYNQLIHTDEISETEALELISILILDLRSVTTQEIIYHNKKIATSIDFMVKNGHWTNLAQLIRSLINTDIQDALATAFENKESKIYEDMKESYQILANFLNLPKDQKVEAMKK